MAKTQRVRQPTSLFYKTAFLFIQKRVRFAIWQRKGRLAVVHNHLIAPHFNAGISRPPPGTSQTKRSGSTAEHEQNRGSCHSDHQVLRNGTGNINVPVSPRESGHSVHNARRPASSHRKPAGAPTMAKTMRKHPGNLRLRPYRYPATRLRLRPEPSGKEQQCQPFTHYFPPMVAVMRI